MEDGHAKTVDEVLNYFNTDPERGLTLDQVKQNQSKYGPNGELKKQFFFVYNKYYSVWVFLNSQLNYMNQKYSFILRKP